MSEQNKYSYCHVYGDTNRGCKRPANEDWLGTFESPNGLVAVVCDGMGGHVGGKEASHTAVAAIQEFLMRGFIADPRQAIVEAANYANSAILKRTAQNPELTGMGSTCVLLIVRDGKVYIGSVGDSRIYLVRNHHIKQLTKDQSYVQMLVDMGEITPEQAEHHPRKNEILNALGLATMKPATVLPDPINPEAGDCFVLCSDGLSGMVSDQDIQKIVSRQAEMSQQQRVATLIQKACDNGGLDNVTCQIVEFSVTPGGGQAAPRSSEGTQPITAIKRKGIIAGLIALAVVLLGGLAWWMLGGGDGKVAAEGPKVMERFAFAQVKNIPDSLLMSIETTEKGLKFHVYQTRETKEDTIPVELKDIEIDYNAVRQETVNENMVYLRIKNGFDGGRIDVKFLSGSDKDTLLYVLPVEKSIMELANPAAPAPTKDQPAAKDGEKRGSGIKSAIGRTADGREDITNDPSASSSKKPGEVVEQDGAKAEPNVPSLNRTVSVKKKSMTILVHAKSGKDTNADEKAELYLSDDMVMEGFSGEKKLGWYKYKNNGQEAVIVIEDATKLPKKATDRMIKVKIKDSSDPLIIVVSTK